MAEADVRPGGWPRFVRVSLNRLRTERGACLNDNLCASKSQKEISFVGLLTKGKPTPTALALLPKAFLSFSLVEGKVLSCISTQSF